MHKNHSSGLYNLRVIFLWPFGTLVISVKVEIRCSYLDITSYISKARQEEMPCRRTITVSMACLISSVISLWSF